jgi:tetratricopeptide (TPR) repeat protein
VKRFEVDPDGRSFLPVSDILRAHKLHDESLELLSQGVERHPTFTVARVVLARELFHKGLINEAWSVLEDSPVPLRENVLAQKLRFKIAILFSKQETARKTRDYLAQHQLLDVELKRLSDQMETSGFETVRQELIGQFRSQGIELLLEDDVDADSEDNEIQLLDPKVAPFDVQVFGESFENLAGFHVIPLKEVFRPGESAPGGELGGIELDSTTLAEIYEKQGHYGKSLAIYRRLLRLTPQNSMLQRKVSVLAKLDREQADVDLTIDPALADRMEAVEIIDRQIAFMNDLLARLP